MRMSLSLPFRSLVVAAAVVAAAASGVFGSLCYTAAGIRNGELWRLLTGHLVHATTYHLLWDTLSLIAIGFLFESILGKRYWMIFLLSAIVVSAGLLVLMPELPAYCGISGVLNGLWVAGALLTARQFATNGRTGVALLFQVCVLADLGKIAVEAATGAQIFTDAGALGSTPVPLAHALGALAGLAALIDFPEQARWRTATLFSWSRRDPLLAADPAS